MSENTEKPARFIPHPEDIEGKAIILGCPVYLLTDGSCTPANWLSGFLLERILFPAFGFDGYMMAYEGSYWRALRDWLRGDMGDGDAR